MNHEALVEYLDEGDGERRRMQHSHEALDRPGGFSRVNLLAPLRHRDFRLLWTGMTVSLLGDGIFLVAMAWQAYELWNAPAALSLLGIGDDHPDDRLPPPGGRPQRPARPAPAHALRGRRARGRRRRARRARPDRPAHVLGARGPRRPLRRRHGVLHARLRGDRPRHRPARGPRRRRTRSTSSSGRSRSGSPARRSAACSSPGLGTGSGLRHRRGVVRRLHGRDLPHAAAGPSALRARRLLGAGGQGGPPLRPPPRLALGDAALRDDRLPRLHGPGRGAAPVRRQERAARLRRTTSGSSSPPAASARSAPR